MQEKPKKRDNKILLLGFAILLVILAAVGIYEYHLKHSLKQCPEAWIINQLPTDSVKQDQYLLIDGARHDLNEMNVNWVKKNCSVKGPTIY